MGHKQEWLPTTRMGKLEMAKAWLVILGTKAGAWGVPAAKVGELETLTGAAETAVKNTMASERAASMTQRIRTAFSELTRCMRDIKRRYFFIPPLTEEEWVALGLKLPDTTPTHIGPPKAVVSASIFYPHSGALGLRISPVAGHTYDARAEYGFRIHYGVLPHGGADQKNHLERQHLLRKPESPEELPKSYFTGCKKDIILFKQDESGMTCFINIRYENTKGDAGPWGPMIKAVIP